eukprot:NODE_2635_length_1532_cov_11.136267_g2272_i0.p1 GENE.NODE_2635_length_1532_cov_11.136267_g2272_i0~~NODE_2635_length_1532_cov_11.136267_g2272_i0.p1  ORF type:complete len:455 (+),score=121.07 NODE_2635_length_1532_cov_11.136267_g2272_i0:62-1426(+)
MKAFNTCCARTPKKPAQQVLLLFGMSSSHDTSILNQLKAHSSRTVSVLKMDMSYLPSSPVPLTIQYPNEEDRVKAIILAAINIAKTDHSLAVVYTTTIDHFRNALIILDDDSAIETTLALLYAPLYYLTSHQLPHFGQVLEGDSNKGAESIDYLTKKCLDTVVQDTNTSASVAQALLSNLGFTENSKGSYLRPKQKYDIVCNVSKQPSRAIANTLLQQVSSSTGKTKPQRVSALPDAQQQNTGSAPSPTPSQPPTNPANVSKPSSTSKPTSKPQPKPSNKPAPKPAPTIDDTLDKALEELLEVELGLAKPNNDKPKPQPKDLDLDSALEAALEELLPPASPTKSPITPTTSTTTTTTTKDDPPVIPLPSENLEADVNTRENISPPLLESETPNEKINEKINNEVNIPNEVPIFKPLNNIIKTEVINELMGKEENNIITEESGEIKLDKIPLPTQ